MTRWIRTFSTANCMLRQGRISLGQIRLIRPQYEMWSSEVNWSIIRGKFWIELFWTTVFRRCSTRMRGLTSGKEEEVRVQKAPNREPISKKERKMLRIKTDKWALLPTKMAPILQETQRSTRLFKRTWKSRVERAWWSGSKSAKLLCKVDLNESNFKKLTNAFEKPTKRKSKSASSRRCLLKLTLHCMLCKKVWEVWKEKATFY